MASWKNRLLFNAGKVVLIKLNLIGVPQFFMIWFKILKYLCNDMDITNKNFFWNSNKEIDT